MVTTIKKGRAAAVLAAVTGLLLSTAAAASADGGPNIKLPEGGGSITITKLAEPDVEGVRADGLPVADLTGHDTIKNVKFEIARLTEIDLTTVDGWDAVETLTVGEAKVASKNFVVDDLTDENGVVTFSGLDLGVYLVTETETPDNVVPSAPFLVTLPLPHPNLDDTWLYNVNVYPKNARIGLTKTVVDQDAYVLGDDVEFEVLLDVPKDATSVVITDVFDGNFNFALGDASFKFVTVNAVGAPTEYAFETEVGSVNYSGNTLTVTFDDPAFLAGAKQVGFRAVVQANAKGEIPNTASYVAHTPNGEVKGDSLTVETKWGQIVVTKRTGEAAGTLLPGAEFAIYASAEDAETNTNRLAYGVSDDDGKVTFDVRYSDFENNGNLEENRIYYLVETAAPAGYDLRDAVYEAVVTDQNEGLFEVTVYNDQVPAIELPLIGGSKVITFTVLGFAAAGLVTAIVVLRRKAELAA